MPVTQKCRTRRRCTPVRAAVCYTTPGWPRLSAQVLLFSHSTRMLDLVQAMLLAAGYSFLRLDGSTKRTDRQKLVGERLPMHTPCCCHLTLCTAGMLSRLRMGVGGMRLCGILGERVSGCAWSPVVVLRQDSGWQRPGHELGCVGV